VSDSRIRGIYYPPEKKEKKIAHVLPKQRSKKRRDSNMRSNKKKALSLPSLSFTPPHMQILI